jgi:hypothetical protein
VIVAALAVTRRFTRTVVGREPEDIVHRQEARRGMACRIGDADYQPFPQCGALADRLNLSAAKLGQALSPSCAVVYCYIIATVEQRDGRFIQRGSGPNFQGGRISLCTCKHRMRTYKDARAWEGAWIAGFTGVAAGRGGNALVYLMRVTHAFDSHAALWASGAIPTAVKRAKAAHLHPLGDIFEPKDAPGDPYRPRSYIPPHPRPRPPAARRLARRHRLRRPRRAAGGAPGRRGGHQLPVGDADAVPSRPPPPGPAKTDLTTLLGSSRRGAAMRVALVRVGVDTGAGGIHGPFFQDGSFEYIPIPDGLGVDPRTYGTLLGRRGDPLAGYFPPRRREKMRHQPAHVDPEFATFTYGDPTPPKAGLRRLERGDLLVFYCGLQGWDCDAPRRST